MSILLTALAALLIATPQPVMAAQSTVLDVADGPIMIYADSYEQEGKSHNYKGPYTITGESDKNGVSIMEGEQSITLSGLLLDLSGQMEGCAFAVNEGAAAIVLLDGESRLYSSGGSAGLQVPEGASLTIAYESTGALDVRGGMNSETGGAGIGGASGSSAGSINIDGGRITVAGGRFSAGIGGGDGVYGLDLDPDKEAAPEEIAGACGNGGDITITGGGIEAFGGYKGAGIGGGYAGDGGSIAISGGQITATSENSGAGIGGGYHGSGGSILITGGVIEALSEFSGAGIGGGEYGDGGEIMVSGGIVTAISHTYGAGIGGGQNAGSGDITVTGGFVHAASYLYASGIGGGAGGSAGNISISGGTVRSEGGSYGAGIGGGRDGSGGEVVITGGSVYAKAGMHASDIGAGDGGSAEGRLTDGTGDVSLVTVPFAAPENEEASLRSIECPRYAYNGCGHGTGELYFYLPEGAGPGTERIHAIVVSDRMENGALSVSTEKSTQIEGKLFAAEGESVTLDPAPDKGYRFKEYSVIAIPGGEIVPVPSSGIFVMPDSGIQVYSSFTAKMSAAIPVCIIAAAIIIIVLTLRRREGRRRAKPESSTVESRAKPESSTLE
ncbi:MAG: hypothetical protein FWG03_00120 [Clostridiales bacterium]|nr:hypothetical protein [Clostridiales bacterium]